MALTRKFLRENGIEGEKEDLIIGAHVETINAKDLQIAALKDERDTYKAEAKKVADLEQQLAEAQKGKAKYEEERKSHEEYRAKVEAREAKREKEAHYRNLLSEAGIDPKRIDKVLELSDLDGIEVKDGAIVDAEKLIEGIKSDWDFFIPKGSTEGANVPNPPHQTGGSTAPQTLKEALYERYNQ